MKKTRNKTTKDKAYTHTHTHTFQTRHLPRTAFERAWRRWAGAVFVEGLRAVAVDCRKRRRRWTNARFRLPRRRSKEAPRQVEPSKIMRSI